MIAKLFRKLFGERDGTWHWHVCDKCFQAWSHRRRVLTGKQNGKYHLCPSCGAGPFYWYQDTEREAAETAEAYRNRDKGTAVTVAIGLIFGGR